MSLSQISAKLSPKGWMMVGGSAAAALVFIYALFSFASAPSYTTLLAGVNPAQTGKITSTLATAGIAYQLQNSGTAVAVQTGQQAQARVALAGAGLMSGTGSSTGLSLGSSSSLGQSDFQQQVQYQSALEQQLDTTIDQIQGISSANVQLALPSQTDQLFGTGSTSPSASVLIEDSGQLDPSAVKGIADLVANAVTGLPDSKVTITDQTGELLWPSSGDGSGGLLAQQNADAAYDSQMADRIDALLESTLGPGMAVAQVNAVLDTNQVSQQSVTYAKKGTPLTTQTQKENLTGATPTSSNNGVPTYTAGSTGNSKYSDTTTNTTWGVNKTVTQETLAPGGVTRQSVSVLVSSKVPASEVPALKAAVAAAAGINGKADTLVVRQIAFAKPATTTASSSQSPTQMLGYAKDGLVALGALIFLFFVRRMLKRREGEAFTGVPKWLRELEAPRTLASLEAATAEGGGVEFEADGVTRVKQLRSPVNVARQQVDELIDRDPDRVAAQVRQWMSED